MFENYFITALRNIYYNKLSSVINIGGLAIGIAACLLIFLFVRDELRFDSWLTDIDRVHKVEVTFDLPGQEPVAVSLTQMPVGPALARDYNQIEYAVRIVNDSVTVKKQEVAFEESVYFVDKDFFQVFDLPIMLGDREQAVMGNANLLLSESMALKYFGDGNPIGEILTINNNVDYEVVGVLKDTPFNSHFRADFVALLDTGRSHFQGFNQAWDRIRTHTYVKLHSGIPASEIEEDLANFVSRNDALRQFDDGSGMSFNLIAAGDIHLYGTKPGHLKRNGDIVTVITFSIIALFILVIASINFMNLSTARAMSRAREVSVRKVHGATQGQLVVQFLGEAMILTFGAFLIALVLCTLLLPWYNEFLNKELTLSVLLNPALFIGLLLSVMLIGLMGGSYPAFVLSSFRPARVLRSNKSSQHGSAWFRNTLVVLQFAISITLSLITAIVFIQTDYARNIDFGFETENKVTIFDVDSQYSIRLKQEFEKIDGVTGVALAKKALPYAPGGSFESVQVLGGSEGEPFATEIVDVGFNFFNLYQIEAIAGRVFSDAFRGDMFLAGEDGGTSTASIVVNRKFLTVAGIVEPSDLIDRPVSFKGWGVEGKIIGVIDDIYTRSLYHAIEPMAFVLKPEQELSVMTVGYSADLADRILDEVDMTWQNVMPGTPISRALVVDEFNALYYEDEQRTQLFSVFAFFAIFVSCLGLYGLASYTISRYHKEIGVRKVLGASVFQIVKLLIWQFTKPVLIAYVISVPIATYLAMDWLAGFEYSISLIAYWYIYVLVAFVVFAISWSTVAGQSASVARGKLVDALNSN